MLQTILIFSPLIVLFLLSLVSFVLGLQRYRLQKEKPGADLDERTIALILFGNIGLAGSGSMLLFAFTRSRTVLLASLLCGTILFLIGELTLRKLIIAGKEHYFSLSVMIIGAVLTVLLFPLVITMHEPFIAIYVSIILIVIPIQMALLSSWKSKRMSEKSLSASEDQLNEK
jgi:hypothetical protein